jgi:hypothetical protein
MEDEQVKKNHRFSLEFLKTYAEWRKAQQESFKYQTGYYGT